MPRIKLATAQSLVSNSIKENGNEIRTLISKGHKEGASIVHFCEGSLSGYAKSQLKEWRDFNFEEIRHELKLIQIHCKKLGIWAVIGSAHELSNGNKPHNSLYIISNRGDVVNRYDKRKCSYNELKDWYSPGFDICIFEIKGLKFSCALCIEIQFPEIFIEAERQDVDCVLFSSYSKDSMFGIQAQGYAASNNYWISMSIPQNESSNQPSQFIGPNGEIVSRCIDNRSDIIISEIDTESEKWKTALKFAKPWRRNARQGDIYNEKRIIDKRSQNKTIT